MKVHTRFLKFVWTMNMWSVPRIVLTTVQTSLPLPCLSSEKFHLGFHSSWKILMNGLLWFLRGLEVLYLTICGHLGITEKKIHQDIARYIHKFQVC